jgi:hypothetical protein
MSLFGLSVTPTKRKLAIPVYKGIHKLLSGRGLKKYSIVKSINSSFRKNMRVTHIENVEGNQMYLSKIGGDSLQLSTLGTFEPFETQILKKEIKKGNFVVDVGASIGYYTLLFAKWTGSKGKVFSFEPSYEKFSILKKNVRMNNYKNVFLVQKYVSNKSTNNFEINSISLDDFFGKYDNTINLIKMDIEGAEGLAMKGMKMLLEKNKDIKILTEFHTIELRRCGIDPNDFLNNLKQLGFSLYNINEKRKILEKTSNEELLKNYPAKDFFTNIFCKRE